MSEAIVTREHREAIASAFKGHYPDTKLLAQLLATREQAAYQRGLNDRDPGRLQSDVQRIRERLAEERGRESAQGGWVAVTERLPELEREVLAYYRLGLGDGRVVARRVGESGHWYSPAFPLHDEDVVAWAELPGEPRALETAAKRKSKP